MKYFQYHFVLQNAAFIGVTVFHKHGRVPRTGEFSEITESLVLLVFFKQALTAVSLVAGCPASSQRERLSPARLRAVTEVAPGRPLLAGLAGTGDSPPAQPGLGNTGRLRSDALG